MAPKLAIVCDPTKAYSCVLRSTAAVNLLGNEENWMNEQISEVQN